MHLQLTIWIELLGKEAGFSRTQRIFAWLVCLGVACITAEC